MTFTITNTEIQKLENVCFDVTITNVIHTDARIAHGRICSTFV